MFYIYIYIYVYIAIYICLNNKETANAITRMETERGHKSILTSTTGIEAERRDSQSGPEISSFAKCMSCIVR